MFLSSGQRSSVIAVAAAIASLLGAVILQSAEITSAQGEALLAAGRDAAARGDFAGAVALTRTSLERANAQLPANHWARAYLLDDLARWQSALGTRAAALKDAESALEVARAAFVTDPQRIAYFALDVGVLRFQQGDCGGADALFGATLPGLPASALRDQLADSAARVAWSMGDLGRAREIARSVPPASPSGADAALLLAQLDIESRNLATARRQLDAYRTDKRLGTDETRWPQDYTDAELAYALASSDLDHALARARRLVEAADPADSAARAAALHRLGQALSLLGRFAEAERALNSAARLLEGTTGEAAPAAANVYHDLAWTYRIVGDYPRSEFYFERALATAGRCTSAVDTVPILMARERAMLRIDEGKSTQALADADEALRKLAAVREDTRSLRGLLIATRAFALARNGDAAGSEAAMQEAIKLIAEAEGADSLNLALGYAHLADLAYRRKAYAVAQRQANEVLQILEPRRTQSIWGTGAALSIRAAAGSAGTAATTNAFWADTERFIGVTEQSLAPAGSAGSAQQSEIVLARAQAERLLEALPRDQGAQLRTVARLMQLPHMSDATATLQSSALEATDLAPPVLTLVRTRASLLEQSQAARSSLLLSQQRGDKIDAGSVARLDDAMDRLAKLDAELLRASPGIAGQFLQHAVDPMEIQAHLKDGEKVLLQVITDQAVHELLIDRNSVAHRSIAVERQHIRLDVRQLRRALDLSLPPDERLPFDAQRANALYKVSVGLFEKELTDCRQLIVVADDAFQSIPWSLLVDQLDGAKGARSYLVDRMAISTLPSLQSLLALRTAPVQHRATQAYAAFANPRLDTFRAASSGSLRGSTEREALDLLGSLPLLPDTALEVTRIADLLGGERRDIYLGDRATESNVRAADLGRFRVLSFATHGLMAGEIPGLSEPALILTRTGKAPDDAADDGILTASEIAGLSLRADLVILSACNTGRVNSKTGVTGISGLARAFFAAGARSLLVSHWSVASEPTERLLGRTVELLAASKPPGRAESMRQAMLWMKNGGAGQGMARPEFWAAFAVVGEGD